MHDGQNIYRGVMRNASHCVMVKCTALTSYNASTNANTPENLSNVY